jgi:uncharacterized protein (TIGR02001 family)
VRGVAFVLWAFAGSAGAQFSGTVSAVSDYRYRGITLSDKKPALQGGLNYDGADGWYAGAFGSTVRLAPPVGIGVQGIVFGGFAHRLPSGVTLEAGGDYSIFSGGTKDNYGELFLGAATDRLNARVYYSPRYFGQGSDAVYGELNASQPLIGTLRLVAHVGFLRARYETGYGSPPEKNVVDGRVGIGADFASFHAELAWVGVSDDYAAYRITGSSSPNTVVLTVSFAF